MATPVLSVRARAEARGPLRKLAAAFNRDPGLARAALRAVEARGAETSGRLGRIVTALRAREAELRAAGLAGLWVFGSVARGADGPDSDLDLLYALDPSRQRFDALDLAGLARDLTAATGLRADLVPRARIPPRLREGALAEAICVFE
jgi:predicted nucleotidyltransferase